MGGPAAGPLEAGLWGTPSSSISPLGSARRRVWAPGPFFMYPLLLSFSLSPRLFVTESGGPAAGGGQGSLGGRSPAPPPSFCPLPWLMLRSSCHSEPPCPMEAGPALLLPMPSTTRKLAPGKYQGRGRRGKDGQEKGAWGSVHPLPPGSTEQSHGFRYPPVSFLLQPQSHQVSGLRRGPGRGEWSGRGP